MKATESHTRPSNAELARTMLAGHFLAYVRVPWSRGPQPVQHLVDANGDIAIFVSETHELARVAMLRSKVPAAVTVDAVSAKPGPDRAGGRLEVGGILSPLAPPHDIGALVQLAKFRGVDAGEVVMGSVWALALRVEQVRLTAAGRTTDVDLPNYVSAEPDPILPVAQALARHLTESHDNMLP